MSWFSKLINGVKGLFGPKGQKAIQTAMAISEIAVPIIEKINEITGNSREVSAVLSAYAHYGVPVLNGVALGDPKLAGVALRDLATSVLRDKLPANKAGIATQLLNTAVELAIAGMSSK